VSERARAGERRGVAVKQELAFPLRERLIFLVLGGSRLYGLNTEKSDTDCKGVAVPPKEVVFGCDRTFEQAENHPDALALLRPEDFGPDRKAESVVYALPKFLRLCADCNPNIIETLWAEPADIRHCDRFGEKLLAHRDLFLTRRARFTFQGYAESQLKRIKTHRRWLLQPPAKKPERADYNLPMVVSAQFNTINDLIKKELDHWELHELELAEPQREFLRERVAEKFAYIMDAYGLKSAMIRASGGPSLDPDDEEVSRAAVMKKIGLEDNLARLVTEEYRYRKALWEYRQFELWKQNRNADRAELERHFGYDTKHAMHLVRLLRMGREILADGRVIVKRPDREELLAIRAGQWSYDQLMESVESLSRDLEDLLRRCPLPAKPDMEKVEALCVELMEERLREG
jgi:predicted nucleotidyltransferase